MRCRICLYYALKVDFLLQHNTIYCLFFHQFLILEGRFSSHQNFFTRTQLIHRQMNSVLDLCCSGFSCGILSSCHHLCDYLYLRTGLLLHVVCCGHFVLTLRSCALSDFTSSCIVLRQITIGLNHCPPEIFSTKISCF